VEIELRGRLVVSPVAGDDWAKTVAVYRAPAKDRRPDPAHVAAFARDYEALGFDSILVNQRSSYADPWVTATWAAAATEKLRIAVAHRVGLQAPTSAARSFASLDVMSGGRAAVHIIQGSTDEDMQRDGDFLPKPERYRRAGEFMQIFMRELLSPDPFDFDGSFYKVRNAWSSVRPVSLPHPPVSAAGASEEGIAFCSEHADIYAMMGESLAGTRQLVERVRAAAASKGRTLRFWRDCNFIMAATDEDAWRKAHAIVATIEGAGDTYTMWETASKAGPANIDDLQSVGHRRALAEGAGDDPTLFYGAARAVGGAAGPAFVGSPATVAGAVLEFCKLGVEILTIGAPIDSIEDRRLLTELTDRIRTGARQIPPASG